LYFYHTPFRSLLEQGEMCEAPRARWQVERGSEVRESERDAHATHTRHVTMQGVGGPQSMHAQELVSGSAHPSFCITRSVLARAAGARGCSGRVTSHLIWITSCIQAGSGDCMSVLSHCMQCSAAWASLTIRVAGHAHATRIRISLSWPASICLTAVYFERLRVLPSSPRPEGETQFKKCCAL
jgi:hypothetical protein